MEKRRTKIKQYLENLDTVALQTTPPIPYPLVNKGKVREIFDLDDHLLIIATDRLSAFDVIMDQGIPSKGTLLTQLSLFWFDRIKTLLPNHLPTDHEDRIQEVLKDFPQLKSRAMIVKKLRTVPLEAVVRGYLAGSGWKEYEKTGKLFEYDLPIGLKESSQLPKPLFTPTTKATEGHDMPVSIKESQEIVGKETLSAIMDCSFDIFKQGQEYAKKTGLILADTKFEFGTDQDGNLYLIDEILTPDSSRYWPADQYKPGKSQPSFDKQFVRDFLDQSDWNKTPPPPTLPDSVIQGTLDRYRTALNTLIQ